MDTNIGVELRQAREQRHLTLDDISRVTKVPIARLEAIERGSLEELSPSIFARGFVREYAIQVGLDPVRAVNDYLAQFQTQPAAEPTVVEPDDFSSGRLSAVPAVAFLALGVGVALYGAVAGLRAQFSRPVSQPRPVATSGTLDRTDFAASLVASLTERMRLQIHARSKCTVSATADGEPAISRVLQAGENASVEGRDEVVLRVDNSDACSYWIDGAPGSRISRGGRALTIRMLQELEPSPVGTAGGHVSRIVNPIRPAPKPRATAIPDVLPTPAVIFTDTAADDEPLSNSAGDGPEASSEPATPQDIPPVSATPPDAIPGNPAPDPRG